MLDILSTRPRLSVRDLYALFLQKTKKKISIQAFYSLIRKMIEQRILVKEGPVILIDASWVATLIKFTDKVKNIYLTNETTASNIVLRPGEKREIVFDTVMAMDNFWTNALIIVLHNLKQNDETLDRNVYGYNYHSWFQVARTDQEQSLAEAYEQTGFGFYLISGSHLFLDKAAEQTIDMKIFRYKTMEPNGIFRQNYYVTVVGDTIFETKLPQYIHELMEKIYEKTKNIAEFDRQEILKIIQLPARTTLMISNDKKRASQIKRDIRVFFDMGKK